MDDWQKEWLLFWDGVFNETDRFFQTVTQEVNEAADSLIEWSEELAEQLQIAIAPPLEQLDEQLNEMAEPLMQFAAQIDAAFNQAAEPVSRAIDPVFNQHPVCIGCRHYHGQMYNGVMLVCGMHPYGVSEGVERCPDKELMTWPWTHAASDSGNDPFDDLPR